MGVEKYSSFICDSVEVRSVYELVDRAFAWLITICAGVSAPVISKSKNDIWPQYLLHDMFYRAKRLVCCWIWEFEIALWNGRYYMEALRDYAELSVMTFRFHIDSKGFSTSRINQYLRSERS
jgi:hypothetical protein